MASVSGECVAFHGASHYWGFQFYIQVDRSSTPGDNRIHVTGYLDCGAWNLWSGANPSHEYDNLTGSFYVLNGNHGYNVFHGPFSCPCAGDNNLERTYIDFWESYPGTDNIRVWGDCYGTPGDSGSGQWWVTGIPPYVPPCDPNPVGAWGNPYATVPSHPTSPNTQIPLPTNSVLTKIYDDQDDEWDIAYPRITLENIYRYPPLIRSLAGNKSESDAFNIPFDTDESPVKQRWGYYDNTYFYIYRSGLYEVSCNTVIIDRKPGVGPHNCGRNGDGNNFAWLKLAKNPTSSDATFLSGKTAHNWGSYISMGVHNILPLNAGDKVFARVGWQYGNGSTCDGVSGCQGGISYDMRCTIGGVNSGVNTRMSITPLVFYDEEISYT